VLESHESVNVSRIFWRKPGLFLLFSLLLSKQSWRKEIPASSKEKKGMDAKRNEMLWRYMRILFLTRDAKDYLF
jgi:hypothetical protein